MALLALFFVLACAPVWIVVSLHLADAAGILLSTMAPTFAALVVVAATKGRTGLAALGKRALIWRVPPRWAGAALLVPALCVLVPIWVAHAVTADAYRAAPMTAANRAVLAGVLVFAYLEELGWMGFAMPKLLESLSPLPAAVTVGLIQGLYHVPVLLLGKVPVSIPAALVFTVSLRVVMTWVYLATSGSVLYAAVFHATLNAVSSFVVAGINPRYFDLLYPIGFVVGATIVVATTRGALRSAALEPATAGPRPGLEPRS